MDLDDVIIGQRANFWCKTIGSYGDPLRMIFINKLAAGALNHFGSEGGRGRIAKPHTLIQKCIAGLHQTLGKWNEKQELIDAHRDKRRLADQFPSLAGTSLLDLGSGSGHLGGWLSTLGVRYTGVEPSADLHQAAQGDQRLRKASLFQASIQHFCKSNSYPHAEAPTLISIIGVVDHLAAPEENLGALFDFLTRRKWLNVPMLVATFDPDFFLPSLPIRDHVRQTAAHYGVPETLGIRDPAAWEEMFVNCGFHLLEQRPLHISGLPQELSRYLQEEHERIFAGNALASGGGMIDGEVITRARVPPRQGPFYFWLLCPRNVTITRRVDSLEGAKAIQPRHVESFAQDEPLSVIGNLGPRIYRVIEGRARFASSETGPMDFDQNKLFGQLETSCNYVSSRVLGTLVACAGSQIETIESRQVLHYLSASPHFGDALFLSLLHHLSSVQFKPFVTAKRSDTTDLSNVLTGKSYSAQSVRNIAACLLQASANAVDEMLFTDYRSRILVRQGADQMGEFIYGPKAKREVDRLMEILPELVQANVIDSFSAYSLEDSGAHERFDEIESTSENDAAEPRDADVARQPTLSPLHIGWQAARFIHHCFPLRNADRPVEDLSKLALAISAFLGLTNDRKVFKSHWAEINKAERRNHKQAGRPGLALTSLMPKTETERCKHIVELVQCSKEDSGRLRDFLVTLRFGFDYNEKGDFAQKHGLSRFIVVRDIPALIACLLNDGDMWNTAKQRTARVKSYMKQEAQRPRIIAYIQECIAHAGRQSGLDKCPW